MRKAFVSYILTLMIFFPGAGFGQKGTFTRQPDGILVTVNSEKIQLRVMGEKTIRVTVTRLGESLSHKGLVVINPLKENVKWDIKEQTGTVVFLTPSLQVKVNLTSGQIQFLNKEGSVLLQENGREITPAVVLDEKTNSIVQKFKLSDNEALYGLGQYQDGNMNLRNKTVELYQFNMRAAIPMLVSTKNYGLLWDNYSLSKFADGPEGMSIWSEVGDGIDYYFFAGNSMDDVV